MISLKHLIAFAALALFAVSCAPYPPEAAPVIETGPDRTKIQQQQEAIRQAEQKAKQRDATRKKRAADKRREVERRAKQRREEFDKQKTTFEAPSYREPLEEKRVVKKARPVAKKIPGKPGYVYNPYTYEPVDVRGISSGSLVWDPNDPDKVNHKFRVP